MSLDTVLKHKPLITVVDANDTDVVTVTLRDHARAFMVRSKEEEDIRIAFASSEVDSDSGDWFPVYGREAYWEDDIYPGGTSLVIYILAPNVADPATTEVAVLEWL